jgi:TonB family protein
MKRTIAAILAVSPLMLHAQAKSSAQPSSTPVLQSSLAQPASPAAVNSADRTVTTAIDTNRVSTGVVAPKRIYAAEFVASPLMSTEKYRGERTVILNLTIDAKGQPTDLKVVQSGGVFTDQSVLAAVSQYRYQPATLDGQAVAIPYIIKYTVQ